MTYEKFSSFLLLDTGPNTPGTTESHPITIKGIQPWDAGAGRAVTWKTPHSNDMAEHCCVSHSSPLYLRTPSHGSQKLPYYLSHTESGFLLSSAGNVCTISNCFLLLDPLPWAGSSPSLKSTSEVTPCHLPVAIALYWTYLLPITPSHPILSPAEPLGFMKPLVYGPQSFPPNWNAGPMRVIHRLTFQDIAQCLACSRHSRNNFWVNEKWRAGIPN